MGVIEKIIAAVMFPLALLIIIEEFGFFSVLTFFDKTLFVAVLMIALQLVTLFFLNSMHQNLRTINMVSFVLLILPSLFYLLSMFVSISFKNSLPLMIGVMGFVEALYSFH
jgi:hypothetical protein